MEAAAAAMSSFPAPPCTSLSPSVFLIPCSSYGRSTAPRAVAVRRSAAAWAQRTLSATWVPSGLVVARPAARKARLEELDTTNMLLRQRIVFLGSPVDDTSVDLIINQLLLLDAEDQTKDIKLFINSPGGSITAGAHVWPADIGRGLTMVGLFEFFHLWDILHEVILFQEDDVHVWRLNGSGQFSSKSAYRALEHLQQFGMGVYDAMKFCKADVSTVCFGLAASIGAFLLAAGTKGKRYCMPNARVMIHQPSGGAGGKVTELGLQIREMMYEKIKISKILSRITGKSEEQIDEDTNFDYFMSPWEAKDYGIVDSIIDEGKPGLVAPLAGSVPPPKSRVWYLWKASGPTRKIMKYLPSEEKLIHSGNGSATGDDGRLKDVSAT